MMALYPLLALLGLAGGFFSGLLGLGGSILMVPLLLFVPQRFGLAPLEMRTVAAISIAQVAAASLAAVMVHAKQNAVSRPLVMLMGSVGAAASLTGGLLSSRVPSVTLLLIFALISTVGALMMFIPRPEVEQEIPADQVRFNRTTAAIIAISVGLIGGLIGAAGAFIYVPLLLYVLHIPTRVTLGSTLAVVLLGALSGLIGKLITGQVPLDLAAALVVGAVPGARWGGLASRRFSPLTLRRLMTAVVLMATAKLWAQLMAERQLTMTPALLIGVTAAVVGAVTLVIICRRLAPRSRPVPQFRWMGSDCEPSPRATYLPGGALKMTTKVAVIYYSSTGNTHQMAEAVAEGAQQAGAEVRLRKVEELAPESAIASNPGWQAHHEQTKDLPTASMDDLEWADAVILGTPTRFGSMAAQLKQFIDLTGGLWFQGKLANKVAAGFVTASNAHGGQEATILSLYNTFYHWGAIVAAPGYTDQVVFGAGGNPYGASATGTENGVSEPELAGARHMGSRVATVANWVASGRTVKV